MDLYMAGSTFKGLNDWVAEHGYNKLFSQENDRREIANWVDYKRSHPGAKSKLLIDSGAFSAHTKGIHVNVDEYIEYLNKIDDGIDLCVQVDEIPGEFGKPKSVEDLREAPRLSWENYLYMRPRLKSPEKLLPVFHQGEDFDWLKNMLEWKDPNGNHIPYIGISPANDVSVKNKEAWLKVAFDTIKKSSNPNVKTHAFGMTSLRLLEKFPFTSADSTSWLMSAVTGSIFSDEGTVALSKQTDKDARNMVHFPKESQEHILKNIEELGFKYEDLVLDYKWRQMYNISYLAKWSSNYQYKGTSKVQRELF